MRAGVPFAFVHVCFRRFDPDLHAKQLLRRTVDAGRGIGRRECDDSERDRGDRPGHESVNLGRGEHCEPFCVARLNSDWARKSV